MSYNIYLVHVPGRSIDGLQTASLTRTGRSLVLEEAMSAEFQGIAAVEGEGGTTLIAGPEFIGMEEQLHDTLRTEVVAALFGGVSDVYGWSVLAPGVQRQLVHFAGEVVKEIGNPVLEEDGLTGLDEDALFDLFEQRTGVRPGEWDLSREAVLLTL
ncbi:MAG: hypothetical protein ABI360_08240 [Allobranchiibius sp.]